MSESNLPAQIEKLSWAAERKWVAEINNLEKRMAPLMRKAGRKYGYKYSGMHEFKCIGDFSAIADYCVSGFGQEKEVHVSYDMKTLGIDNQYWALTGHPEWIPKYNAMRVSFFYSISSWKIGDEDFLMPDETDAGLEALCEQIMRRTSEFHEQYIASVGGTKEGFYKTVLEAERRVGEDSNLRQFIALDMGDFALAEQLALETYQKRGHGIDIELAEYCRRKMQEESENTPTP